MTGTRALTPGGYKVATPSRVDHLLDDAQLARVDAHAAVELCQRIFYNAMSSLEAAYHKLQEVEAILADGRDDPGPLFTALADLRELPAVRRAAEWDGVDRREAVAS